MKRCPRTSSNSLDISVTVASRSWIRKQRTVVACAKRAAGAAAQNARDNGSPFSGHHNAMEISILLTTDHALRRLNHDYRGIDKPTNVLSFPTLSYRDAQATDAPVLLGDVAVAFGVSDKEARTAGKSLPAHLSHLVVHGVLHLLGYDHQSDHGAKKMEELEIEILADLGIANPYIEAPNKIALTQRGRGTPRKNTTQTRAKK